MLGEGAEVDEDIQQLARKLRRLAEQREAMLGVEIGRVRDGAPVTAAHGARRASFGVGKDPNGEFGDALNWHFRRNSELWASVAPLIP